MHSDLREKICEGGCVNNEHAKKLMQHFVDHGMKENRVFCTPQINKELRGELTRAADVSVGTETAIPAADEPILMEDTNAVAIPAVKEGYRVEPFQRRYKRGAIRGMQI
jgi:hypothetical protein